MTGFVTDPWPDTPALREAGLAAVQPTAGEVLGATAGGAWDDALRNWKMLGGDGHVDETGRPVSPDLMPPAPVLDPEEANRLYGISGQLKWTAPIAEDVASALHDEKRQQIVREDLISRGLGGLMAGAAARTAVSMAVSLLDPVNVAASFVPVVGPARYARMLEQAGGAAGRAGVRLGVGAAEGAAGTALLQPFEAAHQSALQNDYSMGDALANIAFGSAFGGGLHVIGGAAVDALHGTNPVTARMEAAGPEVREGTLGVGAAQMARGDPVNVSPIVDLAESTAERERLWYLLSLDREGLQREIDALPARPGLDEATQARLSAVQEELAQPALPATRRGELQDELRMLTEGHPLSPADEVLEQARTDAQRTGLQRALVRTDQRISDTEQTLYTAATAPEVPALQRAGSDMAARAEKSAALTGPDAEASAIGRAYDTVLAKPQGPENDPLVRITPDDIDGVLVARGGMKGVNDLEVKGAYGLVKFIFRHGEGSAKEPAGQITREDLMAFPHVIRDLEPTREAAENGQGREWRVDLPGPDGTPRTVVFADRVMPDKGQEARLVTAYVQQTGKSGDGAPLSRRRAQAPGSAGGGFEPPTGYRRGPFDQQPQGQEPPATGNIGARPAASQKNPQVLAAQQAADAAMTRVQSEVAAGRLGEADLAELRAAGDGVQQAEGLARAHEAAAACLAARGLA
ncbi:MAG: hypothetical protein P4L83_21200 [Nevskia sp.]|nr:hypothetical protein [Nevskia sp.]